MSNNRIYTEELYQNAIKKLLLITLRRDRKDKMEKIFMTNDEIKKETDAILNNIKHYNDRLKDIRELCKHENVIIVDWSYRIGSRREAEVCEYCGEFIKYK